MKELTKLATDNVESNKDTDYIKNYIAFYKSKVEPKINELASQESYKQRRKIQLEIVALIKNAGYYNEAKRMKAIFNI